MAYSIISQLTFLAVKNDFSNNKNMTKLK